VDRWKRLESIFHEALKRPPNERDAYLREACGEDTDLQREVANLLLHHTPDTHSSAWAAAAAARLMVEAASLQTGDRLGPYQITSFIASGGMAAVYRAIDTRLGRTVAVKVSAGQFSARFEREARAISALNHSHVCTLYDVGPNFLVMELMEGETLTERLRKGPLPIEMVLRFGQEIADALAAAHALGITHRDLKPGNIMVTKSGIKVLDFGLAKISEVPSAAITGDGAPTAGAPPLTAEGTILGTFHYMAPEQIEGRDADARTDIFALGVVLYEMLTGKRPFEGESRAAVISSILKDEPQPSRELRPGIPPGLESIISRCLIKDPGGRWQSAVDLGYALKWISDFTAPPLPTPATPRRKFPVAIAGLVLLLAALIPMVWFFRPPASSARRAQFEIPATVTAGDIMPFLFSVSPDGHNVLYVAPTDSGAKPLWVRSLDNPEPRMLSGTEGATGTPFWSPDSRMIGFATTQPDAKLKKIAVAGGRAQTLANLGSGSGRGGSWNREGTILFTDKFVLWRIPETGGTAVQVTELDLSLNEQYHAVPTFLPDGRHFIYHGWSPRRENAAIYIGSVDSKSRTRLMPSDSRAIYTPLGFILFLRERMLMAQPFDAGRLVFSGEAFPLAENVLWEPNNGAVGFSVSEEGTLVYRHASAPIAARTVRQWVWVDRSGKVSAPLGAPHNASDPRLTVDSRRVAYTDVGLSSQDLRFRDYVWIYDIQRGLKTLLTTEPADYRYPVWSPDGRRVLFLSNRSLPAGLYEKPADGAVPEQLIFVAEPGVLARPRDWSSDGRLLVLEQTRSDSGRDTAARDLWVLPLDGDRKATPYVATAFDEAQPALSPDGRWLAYTTNESGSYEVVVQSFPDPTKGKLQVSRNGGIHPRWKRSGGELYFLDRDGKIVAVSFTADPDFKIGQSKTLFTAPVGFLLPPASVPYDVTADGQRFLFSAPSGGAPVAVTISAPITVVLNWPAAVKK
jgi:serine/threonine protein kinase